MVTSAADFKFLDSVNHFILISTFSENKFDDLMYSIKSLIRNETLCYSLVHPVFKIYINNFHDDKDYLSFVLNYAFTSKFIDYELYGGTTARKINLFDDISKDCILNHQLRNKMLKSDFLMMVINRLEQNLINSFQKL